MSYKITKFFPDHFSLLYALLNCHNFQFFNVFDAELANCLSDFDDSTTLKLIIELLHFFSRNEYSELKAYIKLQADFLKSEELNNCPGNKKNSMTQDGNTVPTLIKQHEGNIASPGEIEQHGMKECCCSKHEYRSISN